MSETQTETTTVAEVIADDSRIADEVLFADVRERIAKMAKDAVASMTRLTNHVKGLAELRVEARSLILLPSGHPDWSAKSDAYRLNVMSAEADAFGKLDADTKRRLDGAVRQHVTRTYLERGIVNWIRANVAEMAATAPDGSYAVAEDDDRFKRAVRKEYDAAGLTVPPRYRTDNGQGSGGGPGAGAPSAVTVLQNAIGGLEQVTADHAALALLQAVSALNASLGKPDARYGERGAEFVSNVLARVGIVATITAKQVTGKTTDADAERLAGVIYDPKNDK
jgi:hypothetical protein